ncbi:MAG: MASE1 domain-containing protein, partial [Archangium sp.]
MQGERTRTWWQTALLALGLGVAYAAAGAAGLELASKPGNVTAVWLPAGLALAMLLTFGRRLWPGITLGSLVCNLLAFPAPAWTVVHLVGSALIATSSTVGLWLIARLVERRGTIDALASPSDLLRFTGLSLVGCMVNASGGALATAMFTHTPPPNWLAFWGTWVLGDFAGVVVVTSAVLGEGSKRPRRVVEAIAVFALSILAMQLVFGRPIPGIGGTSLPVSWTVMICAVWAGARLGGRAVSVLSLLNFFLMSWATLDGVGPFGHFERTTALLLTDCVAVLGTIVGLLLVSSEARSRSTQQAVETQRAELEAKVQERTAQLELSSDALLSEAEERGRLAARLVEAQKQEALGRLAG